jgi:hypothetical protein
MVNFVDPTSTLVYSRPSVPVGSASLESTNCSLKIFGKRPTNLVTTHTDSFSLTNIASNYLHSTYTVLDVSILDVI